jgi:hypothetical protein
LPEAVRLYLDHTEDGQSLRALARERGCAASTVMRQIRRYENRRDDPLVDEALSALGQAHAARASAPQTLPTDRPTTPEEEDTMAAPIRVNALILDDATIAAEARRILRRLAEPGSILAIAPDMEKAVVLRTLPDGRTARTAVVDRTVAQAFALKEWIVCRKPGRVASYELTGAGRATLRRLIEAEARSPGGFSEAQAGFDRDLADTAAGDEAEADNPRRLRYNLAESPVAALGRRRDKDGTPFLSSDLVTAAERLREDFELAQMGPRVAQNWDRFLTGGDRGSFRPEAGLAEGPRAARDRVATALRDLGPGLGDMVLRCCCYLEGLEAAERRMGWSARSGKIVLRIALQRLKRHYEETYGRSGPLIG